MSREIHTQGTASLTDDNRYCACDWKQVVTETRLSGGGSVGKLRQFSVWYQLEKGQSFKRLLPERTREYAEAEIRTALLSVLEPD